MHEGDTIRIGKIVRGLLNGVVSVRKWKVVVGDFSEERLSRLSLGNQSAVLGQDAPEDFHDGRWHGVFEFPKHPLQEPVFESVKDFVTEFIQGVNLPVLTLELWAGKNLTE